MPFVPPLDKALQQVTVGAAYVQKVAIVGDSIEDKFPFHAPPLGAAAKARLPDRIRFPQVRPLQLSETGQECNRKFYHAILVLRFAEAESLMRMSLCPDKPTLAGLLGSFVPYPFSVLEGRHDGDVLSLTRLVVNTPNLALQSLSPPPLLQVWPTHGEEESFVLKFPHASTEKERCTPWHRRYSLLR
jgi:hypothetical protein